MQRVPTLSSRTTPEKCLLRERRSLRAHLKNVVIAISDLSNDDGLEEYVPRLKRRKPSSCLADMVSLQTPKPTSSQPLNGQGHEQALSAAESASCVSPIWGHFVDVVFGDEECGVDCMGNSSSRAGESCFAFADSSTGHHHQSKSTSIAATKRSGGETLQDRARHDPYASFSNKHSRHRINSKSTPLSRSSSFVLQDPATLSDALTRLQV